VGVENTEENRRAYRQMLFEAPGCNEFLCAAILDPETVYQKSSTSGKLFPEVLTGLGIVPGIKPHLKVYAIPGQAGSTVMQVSSSSSCLFFSTTPLEKLTILVLDPLIVNAGAGLSGGALQGVQGGGY